MTLRRVGCFAAVWAATLWGGGSDALSQLSDRTVPSAAYYVGCGALCDGDYLRGSLRIFQSEARGAIKTPQSRWIDSICYETMCGECYFQMGLFDKALPHYTAALQLFVAFPDWMSKVQFAPTIRAAGAGKRQVVPWGASSRNSPLGVYPTSVPIMQGQIEFSDIVQRRGGVVQRANLFPITPQEIVRATALALRRRAALLGPASPLDPLTNDVLAAMNRPIGPPNHWSEAWVNLERGLAQAAAGKDAEAVNLLQRAVLAGGEFDHPMTGVALLELGRLAMRRGEHPAAAAFFDEATFAAVNYSDCITLEEAFRLRALCHFLSNGKGFFAPLEPAIQWSKVKNLRQLRASLLLCAAENYAMLGETRRAAAALDEARVTVARRDMAAGALGARMNFLAALTAFQQQRIADGNTALAAAMAYMQHGSLRLFQIGLADQLYVSGGATQRMAMALFGEVLREPGPADWTLDPMESLAVSLSPQDLAMEHWFELAVERKEIPTALDIAEQARRRRFLSTLELGGRIESLRWALEAPADRLPQQAVLQRRDLLARWPAYEQLAQQSQTLRQSLEKIPLAPDQPSQLQEQARGLAEWATVGQRQEAILWDIALRRVPVETAFPPALAASDVQKTLPDRHAALVFFATSRRIYGFLLNNQRATCWPIGSTPAVVKAMQALLREMGQYQANHEVAVKDLIGARWIGSAQNVLDALLKDSPTDFSQPFDELAIVPDHALWYLPFEALQVKADGQSHSWITRFRIRYAPLLSLAAPQGAGRGPSGNTAVIVGKLHPRDEDSTAQAAFEQLAAVVPGAVALRPPPPAPTAVYSKLFQRLVVLDDLVAADPKNPYGWSPAPLDRDKPGSSLSDWFALPWGGPDVIVLPGFHTAAEDAMKRPSHGPPGNEVFLSACGLMSCGARTVLLSRWRTGGQISFDLVREFVQELPRTSPSDAWQRAVLLACDSQVNLEAEPRLKRVPTDESPKAAHPFFWAGYLLLDCGVAPEVAQKD